VAELVIELQRLVCFMSRQRFKLLFGQRARDYGPESAFSGDQRVALFVIGNAPTALIELDRLIKEGAVKPALIVGVPVGFVNVVESKELIMQAGVPYIVARGRKGGSNIGAAIINALLYTMGR
jgi:precorrin isomerase